MKLSRLLIAGLLLAPLESLFAAASPTRPNIVFIFADDWGWGDLSCHGHPYVKTPHIERLAREGIDFQPFNVLSSARNGMRGTRRYRPTPAAMFFPRNAPRSATGASQASPV